VDYTWTLIALTLSLAGNVVLLVFTTRLKSKHRKQRALQIRLEDKVKEYQHVTQFMNQIAREENIDEHLV